MTLTLLHKCVPNLNVLSFKYHFFIVPTAFSFSLNPNSWQSQNLQALQIIFLKFSFRKYQLLSKSLPKDLLKANLHHLLPLPKFLTWLGIVISQILLALDISLRQKKKDREPKVSISARQMSHRNTPFSSSPNDSSNFVCPTSPLDVTYSKFLKCIVATIILNEVEKKGITVEDFLFAYNAVKTPTFTATNPKAPA